MRHRIHDACPHQGRRLNPGTEREVLLDNLLVRIHFILLMITWPGFAPWEVEFPVPGSLASTFLSGSPIQSEDTFY
jgi:hypothetical protein